MSSSGACPSNAVVNGLTAWHFVLTANSHDFASLDVAFVLNGSNVTLSGLTPEDDRELGDLRPGAALHRRPELEARLRVHVGHGLGA